MYKNYVLPMVAANSIQVTVFFVAWVTIYLKAQFVIGSSKSTLLVFILQ